MDSHNNDAPRSSSSRTYQRLRRNSNEIENSDEFGETENERTSVRNPLKRKRKTGRDSPPIGSPLPIVEDSLVQPGRQLSEISEELKGELDLPEEPCISAGYADIYHGTWNNPNGTQVEVAVKTLRALIPAPRPINHMALRQKASIRLRGEISVWTRAKHRNIHPLLGFRSRPRPQLISPWCRHGNLTDYLNDNPHLSRFDKLRLIQQAALGLVYLHSQSPPICHADVKPENVLVNDTCEAALSDFGLSRLVQGLGTSSGLTTSLSPKGTHNYMARELISGEGPTSSCESDVYAFGGLILTVMSGKPPFWGIPVGAITLRVMRDHSPKPEEHPILQADDLLWGLMRRCWEPDPSARPSMRQVLVELERELATAIEQDLLHCVTSALPASPASSASLSNPATASAPSSTQDPSHLSATEDSEEETESTEDFEEETERFISARLLVKCQDNSSGYIGAHFAGLGYTNVTSDRRKAISVTVDRVLQALYVQNSSSQANQLGIAWDSHLQSPPKFTTGSLDRAYLVNLDYASALTH